jgi:G6PDH family F420-dependent oxidoreductase
MVSIGYTLMTEQAGPRDLIEHAIAAEEAGFDFAVSSDHYFPWLDEMGHSPNAWVTLGAVAQATATINLMTYVTAPTFRYHPAVVAQQAATLQIISGNRFTLGLGSGEALNEHIIGAGWPGANTRQDRLAEAVTIISALFDGGYVNFNGEHFHVDSAKLWDLPEQRVPIGIAVSGQQSCELFAPLAQVMVGIDPEPQLTQWWDAARDPVAPGRKVAQLPISWGSDEDAATERAHRLFRWSMGGWKVNAELPSTAGFDGASSSVRPEDVAEQIPCGDDVDAVVAAAKKFFDAGYTDLALVQIGADQQDALFKAAQELLPALRSLQTVTRSTVAAGAAK